MYHSMVGLMMSVTDFAQLDGTSDQKQTSLLPFDSLLMSHLAINYVICEYYLTQGSVKTVVNLFYRDINGNRIFESEEKDLDHKSFYF